MWFRVQNWVLAGVVAGLSGFAFAAEHGWQAGVAKALAQIDIAES